MESEQFEFDLNNDEDSLIVEDRTATPNSVLCGMLNKCQRVFVIGVDDDDLMFSISDGDLLFWNLALERAKSFVHNRMGY